MTVSYTATAKALHWLMAVLFFGLLALGFYMHDLPLSPEKLQLYSWHKWAGVSAFLLVWLRLFWRVTHRPPALPTSMPKLLQLAAHAGHRTVMVGVDAARPQVAGRTQRHRAASHATAERRGGRVNVIELQRHTACGIAGCARLDVDLALHAFTVKDHQHADARQVDAA